MEADGMRRIILILTGLMALSLSGYLLWTSHIPSGTDFSDLEDGRVIVLGHAGMGTRSWHTVNTLSSFKKALGTGADGTEMDVQLTADGRLVAFHDESVGKAECPLSIAKHSYAELKNCLGGLLTVEEVLALGWRDGSVFSFDVKLHGSDIAHQQFFAERINTLKENHPQFRILVESTSAGFLSLLKEKGVSEGLYLYADDAGSALGICMDSGFEGISIRNELISAEQVQRFRSKGVRVMLWGVGTRHHNRQALLKGPDLIQSDRLPHMVGLAKRATHSR
jgi:glycerophosphoryl diester phosphodiesterase